MPQSATALLKSWYPASNWNVKKIQPDLTSGTDKEYSSVNKPATDFKSKA